MESFAIHKGTDVQPGYIYIRTCQSFFPPKDEAKLPIEETPCFLNVWELNMDKLTMAFKMEDQGWIKDANDLNAGQTFSMVLCSIEKRKRVKELQNRNIDFDLAAEVFYEFDIIMMVKYYEWSSFKFEIFAQHIRNIYYGITNGYTEPMSQTYSVKVYYPNLNSRKENNFLTAKQAVCEVADILRSVCANDCLVPARAIVAYLPPNISNNSVAMCSTQSSQWAIVRVLNTLMYYFIPSQETRSNDSSILVRKLEKGVNKVDSNSNNIVVKSLCDKDCVELKLPELKSKGLPELVPINQAVTKIANKSDAANDKGTVVDIAKGTVSNQVNEEKKTFPKYLEKDLIQLNVEVNVSQKDDNKGPSDVFCDKEAIQSNADKYHIQPEGKKRGIDNVHEKNLMQMDNEAKKTSTNSTNKPQTSKTNFDPPQITSNAKLSQSESNFRTTAEYQKTKTNKSNSKIYVAADACTAKEGKPKFLEKLNGVPQKVIFEFPSRNDDNQAIKHHYYNCSENADANKKTLLLVGSDDCGKLSIVNLIWNCIGSDEKFVDTSSKVEGITYFHFGSANQCVKELTIILTPKLTNCFLKRLKELLSIGILNVNALGFVVNSRSETLTSEERSFFTFIRSSFGEVSNHHLMTFLTFCDISRNYPILEELKTQSIKPKCTLELNCSEKNMDKDLDDLEIALIKQETKKAKKVFKTLKDMTLLSVKSTKIKQEKSFVESHLAASLKLLREKLTEFSVLVDSGQEFQGTVRQIWKLAKLVLAMQENLCSEKKLLQFAAKSLQDICSNKYHLRRCFLFLVFCCADRNVTISLHNILRYNSELLTNLYLGSGIGVPLSATALKEDKAKLFCKSCREVHIVHLARNDSYKGKNISLHCKTCNCYGNDHTLWTFQDSLNLSKAFCKEVEKSIREVMDDLPELPFTVEYVLFRKVVSEIFPQYDELIKALEGLRKNGQFHN